MGRAGYFGCLVLLGVVMASISCLAVFGATGAITAERGATTASVARPVASPTVRRGDTPAEPSRGETVGQPTATRVELGRGEPAAKVEPNRGEPPAKPPAVGTLSPRPTAGGPEGNIAQRLDREAVGGGLRVRALGAAKTTQGDRSVLAIYVRMENDGAAPIRVDPAFFRIVDRTGQKFAISKVVEASLPAIELGPRTAAGEAGKSTEGNLTFELPRAAGGLALSYEPPEGQNLRIPLPADFG